MVMESVLVAGEWRKATASSIFQAENSATGVKLEAEDWL
jgi:hypothetical protein